MANTGSGALTLASTLTKTNTVLNLVGGAGGIVVTGNITGGGPGTGFNSDLNIHGGLTTITSTNNNYTGPTNIYGSGTLVSGAANILPIGTVVMLGSNADPAATTNTYDLNGNNQTIAALNSVGDGGNDTNQVINTGGASTLTLTGVNSDTNAVSSTFGGSISGSTSLTVTGGMHTLSGANTYTGVTTISSGTLALSSSVSNNNIAASPQIIVGTAPSSSAVLSVGNITTAGGFIVASGQTLSGYGTVTGRRRSQRRHIDARHWGRGRDIDLCERSVDRHRGEPGLRAWIGPGSGSDTVTLTAAGR